MRFTYSKSALSSPRQVTASLQKHKKYAAKNKRETKHLSHIKRKAVISDGDHPEKIHDFGIYVPLNKQVHTHHIPNNRMQIYNFSFLKTLKLSKK